MKYTVDIGIECHVQLKTKSKLFCGCDNDARNAEPNTKVCVVCLGMPGTLPVLNEQAVNLALRAGLALNAKIAKETKFDRKNYFYPDLPKGYQITQFDQPIVGEGILEVPLGDSLFKVGITRAHLEEDAGKLTHPAGADYSLVDLNRAGTPLLEIVSEPDIHSPAEAKAYATELYNIMRYAEVSDVDLYHGNMRFDVNVSIKPEGSKVLGTRAEVKNLNSFRSVEKAAAYEIERQTEILERGEKVVQETRGWDDAKNITFSQRGKEEAHDYRYFPEPDLPPIVVTDVMLRSAKAELPMLPAEYRAQFEAGGLGLQVAEVLLEVGAAELMKKSIAIDPTHSARIASWLTTELPRLGDFSKLSPQHLVDLSGMVEGGKISFTASKAVLAEMVASGEEPEEVANRLDLIQVSDTKSLGKTVKEVIEANPDSVADYKRGKSAAIGFLVGQVMKASGGKANPQLVGDILKSKLKD